jgi:uroporphyrinogen decarboxylase
LNSRERFFATVSHKRPDRVPLDGWFTPAAWDKLRSFFGTDEDEKILEELGIDFRSVYMEPAPGLRENANFLGTIGKGFPMADYVVKKVGPRTYEDEWGVRIEVDEAGLNWHYSYHPLQKNMDLAELRVPEITAQGRFDNARNQLSKWKDRYIITAGVSTLFRKGWLLCGFCNFLEALMLKREFMEKLLDRLLDFTIQEVKGYLEAGVDVIQLGGDLASEQSLFISPKMWREIFKPREKEIIDSVKNKDVFSFLHSDGNIEEIIRDLVEIGIDILNPIQPECLDPVKVKNQYGDIITLHGTMSLQRTLTFGTAEDVKQEVRQRIDECGYNGGLILAPSNFFTADTPIENIITFYNYAKEYSCTK